MAKEFKFPCKCGREITVYAEKGELKHRIRGHGDAILDALDKEPDDDDAGESKGE